MAMLSIPGTPGGKVCIFRFDRIFDGLVEGAEAPEYRCRTDNTVHAHRRVPTAITWRVTASTPCDESKPIFAATGLLGQGRTIARDDGFAHFLGRCRLIERKEGGAEITRFRGTMELIARVGSHQVLGEPCDQEDHIEGWYVAQGVGKLSKHTLRAVIVGKGALPAGPGSFPLPAPAPTG